MIKMIDDCRMVALSEDDATVLRFLRKRLPDNVHEQWLQEALENDEKDMALLLLLAAL